jgi:undecaprenyl-diphosphatase
MSINQTDHALFSLINGWHSEALDPLMVGISSRWLAIPLYLVLAVLLFKKFGKQFPWVLLAVVLMILLSDQLSVAVKFFVERLRPCHDDLLSSSIHLVNNKCGGEFGFYSSHASNTAALALFSHQLLKQKGLSIFLVVWVILVGYSRIYLGAHFPGDVLMGWFMGASIGWLSAYLCQRKLNPSIA